MTPIQENDIAIPQSPGYLRLIRASAWYDIVATAAFATPWTFAVLHQQMNATALALGASPLPAFEPVHMLFANLLGSVVMVWSAVRLWRTQASHGLFDGIARVLFALWQGFALLKGASILIWPFLIAELGFGVAQLAPIAWTSLRRPLADVPEPSTALQPAKRRPPIHSLESALLDWFRAALTPDFPSLANRLAGARVVSREYTAGAGALCRLESDFDDLARVDRLSQRVDGPVIRSPDMAGDAWVTLQVRDGIPHAIEIWAPGADYPIDRHPKVFALIDWEAGDEPGRRALAD